MWPRAYERHFQLAGAAELAGAAAESRTVLVSAMSRYAGVLRDADGLKRLTEIIAGARRRNAGKDTSAGADEVTGPAPALADVEAANLREVSALIAAAALHRAESRGCHRRSDAPGTEPDGRHTLARLDGGHIIVDLEES
jgi:L-aspartate oxidase